MSFRLMTEALEWVKTNRPPTELESIPHILLNHYGARVWDMVTLPLLGPGKFVFLIHNEQTNSGKSTLSNALSRALGPGAYFETEKGDYTSMLASGRSQWDDIGRFLSAAMSVNMHELQDSILISDLGAYTAESVTPGIKYQSDKNLPRVGTLTLWSRFTPNIAWWVQGMESRLVCSLFEKKDATLDWQHRETLINKRNADRYLRALLFTHAAELRRRHGSAMGWVRDNPVSEEMLKEMKVRLLPEWAQIMRAALEYNEDGRITTKDLDEFVKGLKKGGVDFGPCFTGRGCKDGVRV